MLLTKCDNWQLVKWMRGLGSQVPPTWPAFKPDYDYLKRNNTPIFVLSKGSSVLVQTEGVSMESWPKEQKRLFSKLFFFKKKLLKFVSIPR